MFYKKCCVLCILTFIRFPVLFCSSDEIMVNGTLISVGADLDVNNQTATISYMIESIYYDYDSGNGAGGGSGTSGTNRKVDGINDVDEGAKRTEKKYENMSPSKAPTQDIYPDPDKIYSSLKEMREDMLFQLKEQQQKQQQHNNGENVDSSLADLSEENFNKDLKGHDLIDNIMYIYYGANTVMRKGLGRNIIVIGAVFGLAAQILAISLSFLRNKRFRRINNALFPITINLLSMFCMSNFIFIIGVQSSRNIVKCEIIAILLHYLHLATAAWGLIYISTLYQFIEKDIIYNLRNKYFAGYGGPVVYIMLTYVISSSNYEIRNYCWLSVQRGMTINFMIPVSILIIISTVLGTICLRKIVAKQRQLIGASIESIMESAVIKYEPRLSTSSPHCTDENCDPTYNYNNCNNSDPPNLMTTDTQSCENLDGLENYTNDDDFLKSKLDLYDSKFNLAALSLADLSIQSTSDVVDYLDYKRAVRFSLFFEPTFGVCWFLGVVALENSQASCILPVIFIICYNIMCWCLLIKISIIFPMINTLSSSSAESSKNNLSVTSLNKTSLLNESPIRSCTKFADEIQLSSQTLCADTIPLLCSTSSGINSFSLTNISFDNGRNSKTAEWDTINSENNLSKNMDCISTISS